MGRTIVTFNVAVVVFVSMIFFFSCSTDTQDKTTVSTKKTGNVINKGKNYFSGAGWSEHINKDSAIINAIKASEEGSTIAPEVTFVEYAHNFNNDSVLLLLKKHFKGRKFFGWSTPITLKVVPDGSSSEHINSVRSLSLNYPYLQTGISHGGYLNHKTSEEVVVKSIKNAYKNAGKNLETDKPNKIVVITNTESNGVFSVVSKYFNDEIPIFGGWVDGQKIANYNSVPKEHNYIIALLFSEKEIAWNFKGGFSITKNMGQITKYKDGIIYEIDNKKATDVYAKWSGTKVEEVDTSEWGFLDFTILRPIYLKNRVKGVDYLQFMHPTLSPDKNLRVQEHFNLKVGDTVFYTEGKYNLLINHLSHQGSYAKSTVRGIKPSSALVFCCASYPNSIPTDQHPLIAQSLKMTLNDKPWLLSFTNGEHGYVKDIGNIYGNLMTGMLIFPEP